MGADIYLKSKFDANSAKYEPQFHEAVRERDALPAGPEHDKAQERVTELYDLMYAEGYYRDSYNCWNSLTKFGLSWWRDVSPRLNKKGCLSPRGCKWLMNELRSRRFGGEVVQGEEVEFAGQVMARLAEASGGKATIEPYPGAEMTEMTAEDVQYHLGKKTALLALLQEAIDLKEPLLCSL